MSSDNVISIDRHKPSCAVLRECFPEINHQIVHLVARILLQGGTMVYAAQARVIHSHGFTMAEEARRYTVLAVCTPSSNRCWRGFTEPRCPEGQRFVRSEFGIPFAACPWRIPEALFRTVTKYSAYRWGMKATLQ